ncbi:hypothetical protein MMC16_001366 [Acarospora aff. strigata]|nr:hypothetical protein [Acarospora aff. strigata]
MTAKAIRCIILNKKASSGSLHLAYHVKPKVSSKREGIAAVTDECIELCVAAQPKDGKANKAVRVLLADVLGVAKTNVTVVKGQRSRHKTVAISD